MNMKLQIQSGTLWLDAIEPEQDMTPDEVESRNADALPRGQRWVPVLEFHSGEELYPRTISGLEHAMESADPGAETERILRTIVRYAAEKLRQFGDVESEELLKHLAAINENTPPVEPMNLRSRCFHASMELLSMATSPGLAAGSEVCNKICAAKNQLCECIDILDLQSK